MQAHDPPALRRTPRARASPARVPGPRSGRRDRPRRGPGRRARVRERPWNGRFRRDLVDAERIGPSRSTNQWTRSGSISTTTYSGTPARSVILLLVPQVDRAARAGHLDDQLRRAGDVALCIDPAQAARVFGKVKNTVGLWLAVLPQDYCDVPATSDAWCGSSVDEKASPRGRHRSARDPPSSATACRQPPRSAPPACSAASPRSARGTWR